MTFLTVLVSERLESSVVYFKIHCIMQDVCANAKCSTGEVCVAMTYATCLTLYTKDGFKKFSCERYLCGKYLASWLLCKIIFNKQIN